MNEIKERIAGRQLAEQLIELAELDEKSDHFTFGFWRALHVMVGKNYNEPSAPREQRVAPKMTDGEAARFERELIDYGTHEGTSYGEVPTHYLVWIDQKNERLARYLRSERGQRRQEESDA